MPEDSPTERRQFLQSLVAAGAAAAATTAAAARAQDAAPAPPASGAPAGPAFAETIADYATKLRYEDLPPDVVRAARRTVLDTVGCAIASYDSEPCQIAAKLAATMTGTPAATVFSSGVKSSHEHAVFANGVMIRYLDYNDAYSTPVGGGHPSDSLGALLTTAEVVGASGKDLIAATVVTYEVFCKISDTLDIKSAGLDQSTVLGLASLVGASRLMGLTREQLVNAIGITVGGNTALNQGRVGTLSNWKDYATAEASRKAIFSARLAQAGMTGPSQIFEGPSGLFKAIFRKGFTFARFGAPFGILKGVTKRYPVGQYAQTVVAAAVEMRPFFTNPDQIQEVNIKVSTNAIRVMAGPDKWKPTSHETADHSMPYAAAVVLMYGTIDDSYYEEKYRNDPKLLDLVNRVHCTASAEADAHEKDYNLTEMEIVLKSGARKSIKVPYHRGHWMNPMTDAEMEDKFRMLAKRRLNDAKIEALLVQLRKLEDMPKAGVLIGMTKA